MPDCPRCHQSITANAIACPHCNLALKAHGHPGMTLHRATDETYLCSTCVYDADDTCTFPQRPLAKECTLYTTESDLTPAPSAYKVSPVNGLKYWVRRNTPLLLLLGLIIVSIIIATRGR